MASTTTAVTTTVQATGQQQQQQSGEWAYPSSAGAAPSYPVSASSSGGGGPYSPAPGGAFSYPGEALAHHPTTEPVPLPTTGESLFCLSCARALRLASETFFSRPATRERGRKVLTGRALFSLCLPWKMGFCFDGFYCVNSEVEVV